MKLTNKLSYKEHITMFNSTFWLNAHNSAKLWEKILVARAKRYESRRWFDRAELAWQMADSAHVDTFDNYAAYLDTSYIEEHG